MISPEFIDKITELARPETVEIDGREYSTNTLIPVKDPRPEAVKISTLTGMIDFIEHNELELPGHDALFLHIVNPAHVELVGNIKGPFKNRTVYAEARYSAHDDTSHSNLGVLRLGEFIPAETFNIMLQANFEDAFDRATVLGIVGNLKSENVTNASDDGISQQVTVRKGTSFVENAIVPNPVTLAPFRTFAEIDQPDSSFVLRMKTGSDDLPICALFGADNGAWRNEAMLRIKNWLLGSVDDIKIIS